MEVVVGGGAVVVGYREVVVGVDVELQAAYCRYGQRLRAVPAGCQTVVAGCSDFAEKEQPTVTVGNVDAGIEIASAAESKGVCKSLPEFYL